MSPDPPVSGPAPRVLIVEDEPRLRDLLLDVVPSMGFPALAARTAEEAEKLMQSEACEILILDLQLPGMGGMEFLEKLRRQSRDVQAIVLTGFGSLDAARKAIHLDVVEFLCKPCHLDELEVALDRARRRIAPAEASMTMMEDAVPSPESSTAALTLEEIERRQILESLARHGGNRTAAAAELGISRRTLHYRLSEYRRQGHVV